MSNSDATIYKLLSDLFASGVLSSDGQITYNGAVVGPSGDSSIDSGQVAEEWDDQDVSVSFDEHGAHRIRQVEDLREQLQNEDNTKFAERLPEFFFIPPYGMNSLADVEEYEKTYPDLDPALLRDMQHSISHATFIGMGRPMIGAAIDVRPGEQNAHIPNHRAVDLNYLLEARKQNRTIGELVGEHYQKVVDGWKNPSPLPFVAGEPSPQSEGSGGNAEGNGGNTGVFGG